jgi:hypothetical protein
MATIWSNNAHAPWDRVGHNAHSTRKPPTATWTQMVTDWLKRPTCQGSQVISDPPTEVDQSLGLTTALTLTCNQRGRSRR